MLRRDARSSYKFVKHDVSVIPYLHNLPHSALSFFEIVTKMLGISAHLQLNYT